MSSCRILCLAAFMLVLSMSAIHAQDAGEVPDTLAVPEGYELVDSVIYVPAPRVDSAFVGKSIFSLLPTKSSGGRADVFVYQSGALVSAVKDAIASNASRQISGYRVRIFTDNKQSARTVAEERMAEFERAYPGVPVYMSYANPYFKVTVGDFRAKSEAMQFLVRIRQQFPAAFIVKEGISYPAVDRQNAVIVDTVKFLKPKAEPVTL